MPIDLREFWAFLLVFSRVTSLVATAPVFGTRTVPATAKIGLAGLVSLAAVPLVLPHSPRPPADLFSLIGQIGAEVAMGVLLGFCATLIFSAVQIAGTLIDTQIGFGVMSVLNPYTQQPTAAIGQFYYQLAITMFLLGNGHNYLIGAVVGSFSLVGPGAAHFSANMPNLVTGVVGQLFVLAFTIAVPAAAVLLVVDVSLAIVARAVPQMNVFIVGMPAKVIVGLLTVALLLPALALAFGQIVPTIDTVYRVLIPAAR